MQAKDGKYVEFHVSFPEIITGMSLYDSTFLSRPFIVLLVLGE